MSAFAVVGSMNYDLIFDVTAFPQEHEKLRATGVRMMAGGSAANTAYWLAKLGHSVRMVGAVGDDYFGGESLASLHEAGVATDCVDVVTGANSGLAAVSASGREKRMITAAGPSIDHALARFRNALADTTHVHIASQATPALAQLAASAVAGGASVSVEFNGRDMSMLAPNVTLGFLNFDEWRRLTGEPELNMGGAQRLLPQGDRVIVTMGRDGAACVDKAGITHCPTTIVTEVDRTGGGDAFNAGFLSALVSGAPVRECLAAGLQLAGRVVGMVGARE